MTIGPEPITRIFLMSVAAGHVTPVRFGEAFVRCRRGCYGWTTTGQGASRSSSQRQPAEHDLVEARPRPRWPVMHAGRVDLVEVVERDLRGVARRG